MKQIKGLFRRQFFGGFRRKDVLEYIDELSSESTLRQEKLKEQKGRLEQCETRIKEYEAMVMQYEEQVKEFEKEVNGLQTQVSGLTSEVLQLRGEQERLQGMLEEHQAEVARRHEEAEGRTRRLESRVSELSSLNESLSRQVKSLSSRSSTETARTRSAGENLEFSIGQMLLEAQKTANRIVESARGEAELISRPPEPQESVPDEFSELRHRLDELKSGMQSTLGHLVSDLNGAAERLDDSLSVNNQ